jgi:hypothetical protein
VVMRLGNDFNFRGGSLEGENREAEEEAAGHAGDCSIGSETAGAKPCTRLRLWAALKRRSLLALHPSNTFIA